MRRLLTLLSALSLLLFVATEVLWVRSYSHRDGFEFWTAQGLLELRTVNGSFVLDNDSQRRFDLHIESRISRRRDLLSDRARLLFDPLRRASDQWAHASNRFEKGGANGSAAQIAAMRGKLEGIQGQMISLQMLALLRHEKWPPPRLWVRSVRCGPVAYRVGKAG